MDFFKKTPRIDFMSRRQQALMVSGTVLLLLVASLLFRGMSLGIDFTGGTVVEVGYENSVELPQVRGQLADAGLDNAVVQFFGTSRDVLVRVPVDEERSSADISEKVLAALGSGGADVAMRRVEFVGPQVGEELTEDGAWALFYVLVGILIYVGFRFELRFALGAVVALVHDVVFALGVFSLTGIEFDLTVLAALLAVVGYSLNDTIVIYDRIRENFRRMRKATVIDVINRSLNESLSRTVVTSLTTLVVLLALLLFGGEIIRGFSVALILGVLVGTYSSVYIASSVLVLMGVSKEDLAVPVKENAGDGSQV
ncbi:MAG: protein translocase subunit SecF [Gammaproteobacteria bacterium]|nr:protein translocase subunit SecF [Gammaproteobacteria bacterium]